MRNLGEYCALARKRRSMSQAEAAKRVFVSRPTISRMEKGDPSVSFGAYLSYAFVFGVEKDFALLFKPDRDEEGMWLERRRLESMRRVRTKPDLELDF
jgi:transcriptional regulator with XRE-family HTH domain